MTTPKRPTLETKRPVHARPPVMSIVTTINAKLQELKAPFKAQSARWTVAGNLVLIDPTPDDANKTVTELERWSTSLPAKTSHAQLDTKPHQIVTQRAYIRNDQDKPTTPAENEIELHKSNSIKGNKLALPPRILVA